MSQGRVSLAILVTCSTLLALIFPLMVYFTYPSTEGSEHGLEEVLVDMPVKPPPFLVGSMGYTLHRGRDLISKFTVRSVNHVVDVYRHDRGERVILVLLPYYLEESTSRIVPGEYLKQRVSGGNASLLVEVFETHRGRVCVVLEIRLSGEVYRALRYSG